MVVSVIPVAWSKSLFSVIFLLSATSHGILSMAQLFPAVVCSDYMLLLLHITNIH